MNNKKNDIRVGDVLLQFVGDSESKKYRYEDKFFISKYIVIDVLFSTGNTKITIQIKRLRDNIIPTSANRIWFGDLLNDYEILK